MPQNYIQDPLRGTGAKKLRRRKQQQELQPNEEQSLVGSLTRGTVGTLAAVANVLGTPDAVFHNTIDRAAGGKANPLAPLWHPVSGEGRVTPSEIAARHGLMAHNDPTKWEWGDVGRFGFDVAASPTTYLSGLGGFTKAAKALADSGKATKGLAAGVKAGQRSLGTLSLPGILKAGKYNPLKQVPDVHLGVGTGFQSVPGSRHLPILPRKWSEGIANQLSSRAGQAYNSGPGRMWQSVMSGAAQGKMTPEMLPEAHKATEQIHKKGVDLRRWQLDAADRMSRSTMTDEQLRRLVETPGQIDVQKDFGRVAGDVHKLNRKKLRERQLAGVPGSKELRDEELNYASRSIAPGAQKGTGARTKPANSANSPANRGREDPLRDTPTEDLKLIIKHPRIESLIRFGKSQGWSDKQLDQATQKFIAKNFTKDPRGDRMAVLADKAYAQKMGTVRPKAAIDALMARETQRAMRSNPAITPQLAQPMAESALKAKGHIGKTLTPRDLLQVEGRTRTKLMAPVVREQYPILKPSGKQALDNRGRPAFGNQQEELAKKIREIGPEARAQGLFPNEPIGDTARMVARTDAQVAQLNAAYATLRKPGAIVGNKEKGVPLRRVLKQIGSVSNHATGEGGAYELVRKQFTKKEWYGKPMTVRRTLVKAVLKKNVSPEVAKDVMREWPHFHGPEPENKLLKGFDSFTNFMKTWLLARPARIMRDIASGQAQAGGQGADLRGIPQASRIIHGSIEPGLLKAPLIKKQADLQQLRDSHLNIRPQSDEQAATSLFTRQYASQFPTVHERLDTSGTVRAGSEKAGKTREDILSLQPGRKFSSLGRTLKRAGRALVGINDAGKFSKEQLLHFWKMRGVAGRDTNVHGLAKSSEILGQYTDTMNRMVPTLSDAYKGIDPSVSAKRVNQSQVNYDPSTFSAFERDWLKRIIPFYSFNSRMLPFVGKELATKPGGAISQAVKAAHKASDDEEPLPDYVKNNTSIPLGTSADGTKKFITGLGLMHEPAIQTLGSLPSYRHGFRPLITDILAQSHPAIKGPIEQAFGKSAFQRGPDGPRPIEDMDPTIGRTIANVMQGLGYEGYDKPVKYPGSATAEAFLGNSPLSAYATMARTLSDPRKGITGRLSNTLSGVRMTDVSPSSQDAVIRDALQKTQKELGSKTFTKSYFDKDTLRDMTPEERATADRMLGLSALLSKRSKDREKTRQLKKKKDAK